MDSKHKIWISIGIVLIIIAGISTFVLFGHKQPKTETNVTNQSLDDQRHVAPPINVSQLNEKDLEFYNKNYEVATPNAICGNNKLQTKIEKTTQGYDQELCVFPDNSTCVVYDVYVRDVKKCPQLTNLLNKTN